MNQEISFKNRFYNYFPFNFLIKKMIRGRARRIIDSFDEFIKPGEKVLDVGAGGGWIAKEIQIRKNNDITLLDLTDFNQTDLKLVIYRGEKMPFPDDSFDAVLLNFVLHHTKNPLEVLKEARRVSRNKIIIFEDTHTCFFDKIFLCFWDVISNLPVFLVKLSGEKMPFNFKKVSQWNEIFKDFYLEIIFEKEYGFKKFAHRTLFVLKKHSRCI